MSDETAGGIYILLGVAGYLIPSAVAFGRGHVNAGAILALNLLLGWTGLGWVAALVWSLTAHKAAGRDA